MKTKVNTHKKELLKSLEHEFEGCYVLLDGTEVVYVGESECVPSRIKQHIKEGVKQFDSYRIYYNHRRKELETELIKIFTPKYNISENPIRFEREYKIFKSESRDYIDRAVSITKKVGREIPVRFSTWYHSRKLDFCDFHIIEAKEVLKKYGCFLYVDEFKEEYYDYRIIAQFEEAICSEIRELCEQPIKIHLNKDEERFLQIRRRCGQWEDSRRQVCEARSAAFP